MKAKLSTRIIIYILATIVFVAIFGYYGIDAPKQQNFKDEVLQEEAAHKEKLAKYCKSHPLNGAFESFSGYVFLSEIIKQEDVKKRILVQYSQTFHDLLASLSGGIHDRLDYDDETSHWFCASEMDSTTATLYYYDKIDSLEIILCKDDLYISRDGRYELGNHNLKYPIDENSREYQEHIKSIQAANKAKRIAMEKQNTYMESLTLRPTFNSFDYRETTAPDIIANPNVKRRIIDQYSAKFYELINIWDGASDPEFGHFNREAALMYISVANEMGSYATIRYNSRSDELEVELTIKGVEIDKNGDYDIGSWSLKYFKNDFGEEDINLPYITLDLNEDTSSYDKDRLTIRISRQNGVALMYYTQIGLGGYVDNNFKVPELLIRRESDGKVFNINLEIDNKYSQISYVNESQYDLFFELLENGNLTMSYKFRYGFTDYATKIKVGKNTTKVYSAINML